MQPNSPVIEDLFTETDCESLQLNTTGWKCVKITLSFVLPSHAGLAATELIKRIWWEEFWCKNFREILVSCMKEVTN